MNHVHQPPEFADVLAASRDRFLAYVRRRVSDPELAEDILQDSLLKALQASPTLRDSDALIPWFFRILRNAIVDVYRTKGSTPAPADVDAAADVEATEEEVALACDCFLDLLPSLRPEYAELIQRLDLDAEPTAAVASALGISAGNLKVRRLRARQALRRRLEETCRICADHHCLDCTCKGEAHIT